MTNAVLWVAQGLLALLFVASGSGKLIRSRQQLAEDPRMGWAEDFSDATVKVIGTAEVLGGVGLILPGALDVVEVLTPLAATGLGLLMIGALVVHLRRHENRAGIGPVVLGVLAVVVAWGRFGPYQL